jgi:hypothetical protein
VVVNSGPATAAAVTTSAHAGPGKAAPDGLADAEGIPAGASRPGPAAASWASSSLVTSWTKNGLPPVRRRRAATSAGSG